MYVKGIAISLRGIKIYQRLGKAASRLICFSVSRKAAEDAMTPPRIRFSNPLIVLQSVLTPFNPDAGAAR
jgi:hypothetical protein